MYKFGTIILIPFPFTDLTSSKLRPALIVSDGAIGDDVVVCFISSNKSSRKFSVALDKGEMTGLKVNSFVRFDKIATLSKSIVLGKLGVVDRGWLTKQKNKFLSVFGF